MPLNMLAFSYNPNNLCECKSATVHECCSDNWKPLDMNGILTGRDFSRGTRGAFSPPENGLAPLSYPRDLDDNTHLYLVNSLTQSSAPLYV